MSNPGETDLKIGYTRYRTGVCLPFFVEDGYKTSSLCVSCTQERKIL